VAFASTDSCKPHYSPHYSHMAITYIRPPVARRTYFHSPVGGHLGAAQNTARAAAVFWCLDNPSIIQRWGNEQIFFTPWLQGASRGNSEHSTSSGRYRPIRKPVPWSRPKDKGGVSAFGLKMSTHQPVKQVVSLPGSLVTWAPHALDVAILISLCPRCFRPSLPGGDVRVPQAAAFSARR